ncbi:hypothetical protein AQUCO_00200025v1 [Aquilegia coerulea]|uniref:BED-type domain-containing protein n=1 Tax=Aquilegia coerulea TaxID=218851 RepID=A0A2G5F1A3_AQUCA|nr:hypothetical protein AQUCO_00200025v1 [Aquilegia coerulea]
MDNGRVDGEVVPPLQFVKVELLPSPDAIRLPLPAESESLHPSNIINGSEATSSRKRKMLKSDAWNHFDIIDVKKDDGTLEPKAQCKYCGKHLSCQYASGTSHLNRHYDRCLSKITPNTRLGQVTCTPPEELVVDFTYDHTRACRELARLIVLFELSFSMGEDPHFQAMTQSFNSQAQPVSRFTIRDIVIESFEEERSKLHSLLQSIPGKICLTSAFWKTEEGDGYLCITAHFVDRDWKLKSRIISFPRVDYPHTEFAVYEAIYNSILGWNLNGKVFTLTLDDRNSIDVTRRLKESLFTNDNSLPKQLFHVSCSTYIVNIIVQGGLNEIHHSLENIRTSIRHIRTSKVNLRKFRELCEISGTTFRNLASDICIPYLWNTTYLMLDAAIPYQRTFELFFYDSILEFVPTTTDWKNAMVARDLLKVFYEASKSFSGLNYVSSSEFCHQLSNICLVLSKYENDPSCEGIVGSMKSKLKEYWTEISPVVELAACMDPRYKVTFLEVCLEVIFGDEETHGFGGMVEKIKKTLKQVFNEYTQKKGGTLLKEPFNSNEEKQVGGVLAYIFSKEEDPTFAIYAKRREASSQRCESELERYLAQSSVDLDINKPLDVLDWWKAQEGNYPLLSAMARDLLTVPVSSVPLELAFDSSERLINQCRSYISPKLLEASVCLRDWYKAQEGSQHAKLSELEDLMSEKEF